MENRTHILLMEPNEAVREQLGNQLRLYGMTVTEACDIADARRLCRQQRFDLAVLDFPSPGAETLALVRTLRMKSGTPVILLARHQDPVQLVAGYASGADDYIVKPCNPCELIVRIHAVLRRMSRHQGTPPALPSGSYRFGNWVFDVEGRQLRGLEDMAVALSIGEFRLLRVLVAHPNTVLSRERLLALTAGSDPQAFDRSIDSQVSRLRKKIESDPRRPQLLKTVWGNGYILATEVHPA